MGLMAKYIDAVSDEARDRIIMGQGWTDGLIDDHRGNRCLIGHATEGCPVLYRVPVGREWHRVLHEDHPENVLIDFDNWVGDRFDKAVVRFGMERVVRACKARAGKVRSTVTVQSHTRTASPQQSPGAAAPQVPALAPEMVAGD